MFLAALAVIAKVLIGALVLAAWAPPARAIASAAEPATQAPGTFVIDRVLRLEGSSSPPVEVAWPDRLPAAATTYAIDFRTGDAPSATTDRPRALHVGASCADLTLRLDGHALWRSPQGPGGASARPCHAATLVALPPAWLHAGAHRLTVTVSGDRAAVGQRLPTLAIGWHEALHDTARAAERRQAAGAAVLPAASGALLLLAAAVGMGMAWRWRAAPASSAAGTPGAEASASTGASTAAPTAAGSNSVPTSASSPGTPTLAIPLAALGVAALLAAGVALWPLLWSLVRPLADAGPTRPAAADAGRALVLAVALGAGAWGLQRRLWSGLAAADRALAAVAALGALAGVGGRMAAATSGAGGAMLAADGALLVAAMAAAALVVRVALNHQRARAEAVQGQVWLDQRIRDATAEIERNFRQLAELRVEQVTERERKRIAGDLHDDLGAKLLTIVHTSESERISTLAREALEEMRLSVRGLTGRPVLLHDALGDWRVEVVSRLSQAGIECGWSAPDDPESSPRLSSRAYVQTTRILREATSNIIKHSGASRVEVRCAVADGDFQLVIQDNGNGISADLEHRIDRGHGLASMKSRAKQLQGQCLVESAPGYGTVIRLTIPMDRATEGRGAAG